MPSYSGSIGVLSDKERKLLRDIGVPLTGGATEGIQAEFADIYGSVCGAEETLTLIYSEGQPSFIYKRLANTTGNVVAYDTKLSAACTNKADAASILVKAGMEDDARQAGLDGIYEDVKSRVHHNLGAISSENIEKLYGDCLRLSASQIDKYGECKLLYFLRYGLHAEERKTATVDPAEFGTYVHAVLENLARDVVELGGFRKVSVQQAVPVPAAVRSPPPQPGHFRPTQCLPAPRFLLLPLVLPPIFVQVLFHLILELFTPSLSGQ